MWISQEDTKKDTICPGLLQQAVSSAAPFDNSVTAKKRSSTGQQQ